MFCVIFFGVLNSFWLFVMFMNCLLMEYGFIRFVYFFKMVVICSDILIYCCIWGWSIIVLGYFFCVFYSCEVFIIFFCFVNG